jgi:hypothetical protein
MVVDPLTDAYEKEVPELPAGLDVPNVFYYIHWKA